MRTSMSEPDRLLRHVMRTLSALPSHLARLIYLASLRDAYTGRYLHEGWMSFAAPEEVNSTIRQIHVETFSSVVELHLEALCRELRQHFESLGGPVRETAGLWLELEPFRELQPRGCSPLEQRLFISQMQAALGALRRSPDLPTPEEPAA